MEGSFSANFPFVRGQIRATWRPRSGIDISLSLLYIVAPFLPLALISAFLRSRAALAAPPPALCTVDIRKYSVSSTCSCTQRSGTFYLYTCLLEQVVSNRMLWNVCVFWARVFACCCATISIVFDVLPVQFLYEKIPVEKDTNYR